MNGKREQFSTTLPTKVVNLLRKHALLDNRITMSEMIEIYQKAYVEKLEKEKKAEKKGRELEKENKN